MNDNWWGEDKMKDTVPFKIAVWSLVFFILALGIIAVVYGFGKMVGVL